MTRANDETSTQEHWLNEPDKGESAEQHTKFTTYFMPREEVES